MGIAEETADKLAVAVIAHLEATGDEDIINLISKSLGDSSQTLQEAFITSVRVQRAAIRANRLLEERAAELAAGPQAPKVEAAPIPAAAPAPKADPIEDPAPEPVEYATEDASVEEETAEEEASEAKPGRAALRARELLERRKAERAAEEEAERKAADASARRGKRAVPEVKSDPRLG